MRKKLIMGMAILNGLFAVALFALPANSQITTFAIFDCCFDAGGPNGYCCDNCCWFTFDCDDDEDCRDA